MGIPGLTITAARPNVNSGIDFDDVQHRAHCLAMEILSKKTALLDLLSAIQSYETSTDEIDRSVDTLNNISIERHFFVSKTGTISAFLPVNLPLYSLVLFAIIPSFFASDRLCFRPPIATAVVIEELLQLLNVNDIFQNIECCKMSRNEFLLHNVARSDVVIFTGTVSNANLLRKHTPKDALLIFNGQGINPIVIGKDPPLPCAVKKTIDMRIFNSGQDCAAPDTILVRDDIVDEFVTQLQRGIADVVVGDYSDPRVRVGKILDRDQLFSIAKMISSNQQAVLSGGAIDFARGIVYPTVILSTTGNYSEFFAPVFHILPYADEQDLQRFFDHTTYRNHAMYVSLFGESSYLSAQTHTTVLHSEIVLDVERGNFQYGGTAIGASFVSFGHTTTPRPILISREIARFLKFRDAG